MVFQRFWNFSDYCKSRVRGVVLVFLDELGDVLFRVKFAVYIQFHSGFSVHSSRKMMPFAVVDGARAEQMDTVLRA